MRLSVTVVQGPQTDLKPCCRQMLSRISKLVVRFAPLKPESRSAKEFLARVQAPKAVASNPDCQVEAQLTIKGPPTIHIEFSNKQQDTIETLGLNADQIFQRIKDRSQVLEAADILKKAGITGAKLEVAPESAHATGTSKRVPIT